MRTTIQRLVPVPFLFAACVQKEPLIDVARATCPPPTLFQHAICACGDLEQAGELHVNPGPGGTGSIGVNGTTDLAADATISGPLYAWGGFTAAGTVVADSLVTPADVEVDGTVRLHEASIGGDLLAVGTISIDGALAVGGSVELVGDHAIASRVPYQAPAGGAPCGCDAASFFDVATAVAGARQATDGQPSWDYVGQTAQHLATGSYYVTSAEVVGETTFFIDGNVSLFVDGSLETIGATQWKLAAGASLDLFVSGDVAFVGDLTAGDPMHPGAFRLYVGGDGTTSIETVGTSVFAGNLYAPSADIDYVGDAHVTGSIFARTITGAGTLTIDYGDPLTAPQSCSQPPGGMLQ